MTHRSSSWLLAAIVVWTLVACGWSASTTPNGKRFYDEKFSVFNVVSALTTGSLHPQNGWYSRLSYLPQTAILAASQSVYEWTGDECFRVIGEGDTLTSLAYFVARLFSVFCGAGSVLLTFFLGRRLFSAEVGLLGALFLVLSPWQLRAFVIFKADALLLLMVLSTFLWSLDAAEKPSWQRYLLAGLGVGLAASAKYTGALAAVPLVVATLLAQRSWRSRAQHLVLAGVASAVVFLSLHPYLEFYLSFFKRSLTVYSNSETQGFFSMLVSEAGILLHWAFHGPVLGALALSGLAALCFRLYGLTHDQSRLRNLAMFLSFPIGYSVVYALVTSLPKGNNYLVIMPFTSLAAAWLLHEVWRWISDRLPNARRLVFWPALIALLVLEVWPANSWLYAESVPATTLSEAGEIIRSATFPNQRLAVYEADVGVLETRNESRDFRDFVTAREVAALSDEPEAALDIVDFEVFGEDRLHGPERDFYLRRLLRLEVGQAGIVQPKWFKVRGSSQVVLLHPWFPDSAAMPIEWTTERARKGRFAGSLPADLRRGQLISLDLVLPHDEYVFESLTVGTLSLVVLPNGWDSSSQRFMTERFRVPGHGLRVSLKFGHRWAHTQPPAVTVWRWSPERRHSRPQGLTAPGLALP